MNYKTCLLLYLVKSNGKMSVGLLGKMAVSLSFNGVYVYSPELFPTCVRNVALGCLSMFARVGGIVSPYAKTLVSFKCFFFNFNFG